MRHFYSLMQKCTELRYKRTGVTSNVYMFHQVNDEKRKWVDESLSITAMHFRQFIDKHIQNGYSFEAIDKLSEGISRNSNFITFDDIYLDAYENAISYLTKKQIPFCIFVTSGYLNKKKYITEEILKHLLDNPLCTIGSHTISHPKLRFLPDEEVKLEVSKEPLERIINRNVSYFAFPYGSNYACSRGNIRHVQEAGYKMAFSTYSIGLQNRYLANHMFFIPRININDMTHLKWGN